MITFEKLETTIPCSPPVYILGFTHCNRVGGSGSFYALLHLQLLSQSYGEGSSNHTTQVPVICTYPSCKHHLHLREVSEKASCDFYST